MCQKVPVEGAIVGNNGKIAYLRESKLDVSVDNVIIRVRNIPIIIHIGHTVALKGCDVPISTSSLFR